MRRVTRAAAAVSMLASVVAIDMAQPTTVRAVTVVNVNETADVVDADPATTSLREAIDAANTDGQATEVVLAAGQTYELTTCEVTEDGNVSGDLDHTDTAQLTIFGNGSTIVQTCAGERVLSHLDAGSAVVVDDATITGGNVTGFDSDLDGNSTGGGGGVLSLGRGIFDTVVVTGNSAEDLGGGVRTIGQATFVDSTVDTNTGGGAAVGRDNDPSAVPSLIDVTNTTFDGNVGDGLSFFSGSGSITLASASGNTGDGMRTAFGSATITDTTIDGNGGFGIDSIDGSLTMGNSQVQSNGGDGVKSTGSGGIDLTDVDVVDNDAHGVHYIGCDGFGSGEVIALAGSTITGNAGVGVFDEGCGGVVVENSTVSGNASGVDCSGCSTVLVEFSTISGHTQGSGIAFTPDNSFQPTASLIVRASTVSDNTSPGDGGGIDVSADGSFPVSVVVSESSSISGNTATDGDGGGISVDGADLVVVNSTVNDNTAGDPDQLLAGPFGEGGGVFVRNGSLGIGSTGVSGNAANGNGGGIAHAAFSSDLTNIFALTAHGNVAKGTGGAIDVDGAAGLTLGDSTLTDNDAIAQGGGIAIRNTPTTIERTRIAGNSSGAVGAGIYAFENENPGMGVLIDTSLVTANSGPGAAVFAATNLPTEIRNSTVSGNATVGVGASGGTDLELTFATVVDNAGGNVSTASGDLIAAASVVADPDGGPNCTIGGATISGGSNADTDGSCGFSAVTDQPNLGTVALGTLADNGGPTETHALLVASPLRDAVQPGSCAGVVTDQRGTTRPQGTACDVGAYEATVLPVAGLMWEHIAKLGVATFPITELVDFGDLTPDPASIRVVEQPGVGTVTVERGELAFTYVVPERGDVSPIVVGEFTIGYELCASEDTGACARGTVVLVLADPSEACTVEGTSRHDVLVGTPGDDVICAGGGRDVVFALGGNDIVLSGDGNDIVFAGRGDDVVTGDRGNDVLVGQRGTDWLDGGSGFDHCRPGGGLTVACERPRHR